MADSAEHLARLCRLSPDELLRLIQGEPTLAGAALLGRIPKNQLLKVVARLPEDERRPMLDGIKRMWDAPPAVIHGVADQLWSKWQGIEKSTQSSSSAASAAASATVSNGFVATNLPDAAERQAPPSPDASPATRPATATARSSEASGVSGARLGNKNGNGAGVGAGGVYGDAKAKAATRSIKVNPDALAAFAANLMRDDPVPPATRKAASVPSPSSPDGRRPANGRVPANGSATRPASRATPAPEASVPSGFSAPTDRDFAAPTPTPTSASAPRAAAIPASGIPASRSAAAYSSAAATDDDAASQVPAGLVKWAPRATNEQPVNARPGPTGDATRENLARLGRNLVNGASSLLGELWKDAKSAFVAPTPDGAKPHPAAASADKRSGLDEETERTLRSTAAAGLVPPGGQLIGPSKALLPRSEREAAPDDSSFTPLFASPSPAPASALARTGAGAGASARRSASSGRSAPSSSRSASFERSGRVGASRPSPATASPRARRAPLPIPEPDMGAGEGGEGARPVDGMALLAMILRGASPEARANVRSSDPTLFAAAEKKMFVFDDFNRTDPASLKLIFQAADVSDAALALRFSSPDLQERVLASQGTARRALLREAMRRGCGRVGMEDVDAARERVVTTALRLRRAGAARIDPTEE